MGFLNFLFKFRELTSQAEALKRRQDPNFYNYTRWFKVIHPSDQFPEGTIAFKDGADIEIKVIIHGIWKDAKKALREQELITMN